MREVLRSVRSVDYDHYPILTAIDQAIVFDRSAVVEDRRIVRLADRQGRDIVSRDVSYKIDRAAAAVNNEAQRRLQGDNALVRTVG